MTTATISHIYIDENGRAWVAGTNTKVIEIVAERMAYWWSPEELHLQHPHLTLAQIHAALAYYYDHQAELDDDIAAQLTEFDQMRADAKDSFSRRNLEERKYSRLSSEG